MSPGRPLDIRFLGHSTVLLELDGLRILTDPVLRPWIGALRRHVPAHDPTAETVDVVLISHGHNDHLDLPSLRLLKGTPLLIVPRGLGQLVRKAGFDRVTEVVPEDRVQVAPGVAVQAFPAVHDGSRPLGPRAVALGFVIEGSSSVYFAGDTDIFPEMARLRDRMDVALLPVWGWGPNIGPGHLNPSRASLAVELMRPRLSIPIHWGTLFPIGLKRMLPDRLSAPPLDFARFVASLQTPHEVRILQPGEEMRLAGRGVPDTEPANQPIEPGDPIEPNT